MFKFKAVVMFLILTAGILYGEDYIGHSTITTLSVGNNPGPLLITPNGAMAYTLTDSGKSLTEIDLKTQTAKPPIPLGDVIWGIHISRSGKVVYNLLSSFFRGITPMDLASRKKLSTIPLDQYYPTAFTDSLDGKEIYVLDENINDPHYEPSWYGYLTPYNVATHERGPKIALEAYPVSMALAYINFTPFAYVLHGEGQIIPVDLKARKAHSVFSIEESAKMIEITSDNAWGYVLTTYSNSLIPIKLSTRKIFPGIAVGDGAIHFAITKDGKRAFVANYDAKTITPVDLLCRNALPPIYLDKKPSWVAVTPDNKTLCVVHSETSEVTLIDLQAID